MLLLSYSCFSKTALCAELNTTNFFFSGNESRRRLCKREIQKKISREMSRCLTLVLLCVSRNFQTAARLHAAGDVGCLEKVLNSQIPSFGLDRWLYYPIFIVAYRQPKKFFSFFWIYFPTPWASALGCKSKPRRTDSTNDFPIRPPQMCCLRAPKIKKGYNKNIQSEPC